MTQTQEAQSQEMPQPQPQKEHAWLHQLVGDWVSEGSAEMPEHGGMTMGGTETVRSLGGIWVVSEGEMRVNGEPCGNSRMSLGYDPAKGKFVGTWLGSMMTHLWVYEGTLDADERVLTLDCEGPSFTDPSTLAPYQDVITIIGADHWTLTARTRGEDGAWTTFMTTHYRRTAA